MGYETRLYVVEKTSVRDSDLDKQWAQVIATFDLGKVRKISDRTTEYPPTGCYIYADDGNTQILEDDVGDPLKEIPLNNMITILEGAIREDDYYRRYAPCLALLKGFNQSDWGQDEGPVVLHFGH